MKRRINRRNRNEVSKKIMRCSYIQRVIWDNECCKDFKAQEQSLNQESCKNCKHSY